MAIRLKRGVILTGISPFDRLREKDIAFMKIALIQNQLLCQCREAVETVRDVASRLGIGILSERSASRADALMVLGGDGSVLEAARAYGALEKPFMAVNIGSLGYLTGTGLDGLEAYLTAYLNGETILDERSVLRAQIRRGGTGRALTADWALNDLVVARNDTGRVAGIDLIVDGEDVTSFLCDGLLLATPTGSTAYSLSAGGPLLAPSINAFIVNVICPHTLTSRPLVLPGESIVTLRVSRAYAPLRYSVDGRVRGVLRLGDTLTATTGCRKVKLVTLPEHSPFRIMREKLGWNGTVLPSFQMNETRLFPADGPTAKSGKRFRKEDA